MAETINITATSAEGVQLHTAGKYSDKDIVVTTNLQTKTATANGDITPDSGYAGLRKVTVDVDPVYQEKTVTPSETAFRVTYDSAGGYNALSGVVVNAIPSNYQQITYQEKTVTPSTSAFRVTYDSGYNALSGVVVNAIPSDYGIQKAENDNYMDSLKNDEEAAGSIVEFVGESDSGQYETGRYYLIVADSDEDDNQQGNGNNGNNGGNNGGFGAESYFFINDNYYTFLEGMTWEDWLASEYNTDDYRISYNWLTDDGGIELPTRDEENLTVTNIFKIPVCRGGVRVDPSDTIIAEEVYELDENETEVITFTIDDTEYTATMGMTWGEWLTSGYNKDHESLEYIYFKPLSNVELDGEQFDLVISYANEENRWIENPYGTTMWLSDVPLIEDSASYTSQYVDYEGGE